MKRNVVTGSVFAMVVIVALAGFFYWETHRTPAVGDFDSCAAAGYPVTQSYPEQCAANGMVFVQQTSITEEAIRSVVTGFGQELQFVSVNAPAPSAALAIGDNYSDFVSPGLLAKWENDPSKAPGRTVSSPWPDHIEITSVTAVDPSTYRVEGNVIEITSQEMSGGGIAGEYPASATVQEQGGNWVITDWQGTP